MVARASPFERTRTFAPLAKRSPLASFDVSGTDASVRDASKIRREEDDDEWEDDVPFDLDEDDEYSEEEGDLP